MEPYVLKWASELRQTDPSKDLGLRKNSRGSSASARHSRNMTTNRGSSTGIANARATPAGHAVPGRPARVRVDSRPVGYRTNSGPSHAPSLTRSQRSLHSSVLESGNLSQNVTLRHHQDWSPTHLDNDAALRRERRSSNDYFFDTSTLASSSRRPQPNRILPTSDAIGKSTWPEVDSTVRDLQNPPGRWQDSPDFKQRQSTPIWSPSQKSPGAQRGLVSDMDDSTLLARNVHAWWGAYRKIRETDNFDDKPEKIQKQPTTDVAHRLIGRDDRERVSSDNLSVTSSNLVGGILDRSEHLPKTFRGKNYFRNDSSHTSSVRRDSISAVTPAQEIAIPARLGAEEHVTSDSGVGLKKDPVHNVKQHNERSRRETDDDGDKHTEHISIGTGTVVKQFHRRNSPVAQERYNSLFCSSTSQGQGQTVPPLASESLEDSSFLIQEFRKSQRTLVKPASPVSVRPQDVMLLAHSSRRAEVERADKEVQVSLPYERKVGMVTAKPASAISSSFQSGGSSIKSWTFAKEYTWEVHHGAKPTEKGLWDVQPEAGRHTVAESPSDDDEDLGDIYGTNQQMGHKENVRRHKNVRAGLGCCGLMWYDLKTWYRRRQYTWYSTENPIFQSQIAKIEGHFGSGIVSFFLFTRWMFLLNLVLCLLWSGFVLIPQSIFFDYAAVFSNNVYFRNALDGKKAFAESPMFYGTYEAKVGTYPLGFAYLCCILLTYFGGLFFVLKSIAHAVDDEGVSIQETRCQYALLSLASWEFSLTDAEASQNLSLSVANAFRDHISEAAIKRHIEERHEDSRYKAFLRHTIGWIITILLVGGGCTAIFFLVREDTQLLLKRMGYSTVSEDSFLVVYGPTVMFMLINTVVPTCLYQLSKFERYVHGRTELHITTGRVFMLRMANLLALLFSFYKKQFLVDGCIGTLIGQELYKLVVLDMLVQTGLQLVPKFVLFWWRKTRVEFDMAPLVLVLVYRQALIWLGSLVCPVMPILGTISTAVFFVVNLLVVNRVCQPPTKRWNQKRRNTFFLTLTATTLCMLIVPVSLTIGRNDLIQLWQMKWNTSARCGPFLNGTILQTYTAFQEDVKQHDGVAATVLEFLISGTLWVPLLFVLLAVLYYQRLRIKWEKDRNNILAVHLMQERDARRELQKWVLKE